MFPATDHALRKLVRTDFVLMALIVLWGLLRLAPGIGHDRIWDWDESLHQTVTRHVHDHPAEPTLYEDPVHPLTDLKVWSGSNTWLLKPPGSFWLGAMMMTFTGVRPVAFRIFGLLSELIAALTVYFLGRSVARIWAFVAAVGFLCLPLGWIFTQAHFVGDELDLEITGATCVAVVCFLLAIEKNSWRWALAAGAATGAGYLCKTFLALTPIGMAGVLWALGRIGFCKGPRLKYVLVLLGGALLVAGPWNLYAWLKWPDIYVRAAQHALGFVSETSNEQGVPGWRRPLDAIFNEVNQGAYEPLSQIFVLVVGVWLVVRSFRKRELTVVAVTLWLWATWVGHTFAAVKIHSHLWNSVVAGFVGVAIVLADIWERPPLALAVGGSVMTPWIVAAVPWLGRIRQFVPAKFEETRRIPGLAEGVVIAAVAVGVGWLLQRFARKVRTHAIAIPVALVLCWVMLWRGTVRQGEIAAENAKDDNLVYSREVGHALEAHTPKKSLVLLDHDFDCPHQLEHFNLMFWSDRLVHGGRDPQDYPQAGFHPYLVSPAAEPYAPVDVPADAWMRAYDLAAPSAGPTPLPPGATPLDIAAGNLHVLGYASGRSDASHDHYAFFVHPDGVPGPLPVTFRLEKEAVTQVLQPEATLRGRGRLANVQWFVLPALGPPRKDVREISFGAGPGQAIVVSAPPAG